MLAVGSGVALGAAVVVVALVVAAVVDARRPPPVPVDFSEQVKAVAFERANRRCEYCGERVRREKPQWWQSWREFECDHIIPKSRGGKGVLGNAASSCRQCNQLKFGKTADEFKPVFERRYGRRMGWPIAARGR